MANKYYKPVDYPKKPCSQCGNAFKPKTKRSDFCSMSCRADSKRKTHTNRPPKSCEWCGKEYTPGGSMYTRSKYCSRNCKDDARHDRVTPHTECVNCGKEFKPSRGSLGKYCSVQCSGTTTIHTAHKHQQNVALQQNRYSDIEWRGCYVCGDQLGPRPGALKFCQSCRDALGNAAHTGYSAEFLIDRICGRKCRVCGEVFTPPTNASTTCSSKCYKQTPEAKEAKAAHKAKRRAKQKTNGPYENINPCAVFARDKWTCYLCGDETPRELRGEHHPKAPELDHIQPLSRGGTHSMDNVACSCRECNQKKSDKEIMFIGGEPMVVPKMDGTSAVWITPFHQ